MSRQTAFVSDDWRCGAHCPEVSIHRRIVRLATRANQYRRTASSNSDETSLAKSAAVERRVAITLLVRYSGKARTAPAAEYR